MAAPANHTLCASCGAPHNQWPGIDEDGGDLCDACFADQADDACFADQADDAWFTTGRDHPRALDNSTARQEGH